MNIRFLDERKREVATGPPTDMGDLDSRSEDAQGRGDHTDSKDMWSVMKSVP